MDPNRNKLETLLNLSTPRLLSVFKRERGTLFAFSGNPDYVWSCSCERCANLRDAYRNQEERVDALRDELCKREHVVR